MPVWIIYGLLSAASAALVAIFGKIGIARVDSILATAIRAVIMAGAMILVVISLGKLRYWPSIDSKALVFIVLSGLAGAASWVWYFLALKNGPVAGVVALDRLSIVFAIGLAALFLGERLTVTSVLGMLLVLAGAILSYAIAMSLSDDLIALVGRDQVASDDVTRSQYNHDASIFQATPEVVVFPRDGDDVSAIVRYASEYPSVVIVPRGGGTDMGGGAIGSSVIMDMTRHMQAFVDVGRDTAMSGQDGYATAQPGIWYRDFERATMSRGMLMPSYPASREICTLGGMVANNSGGERSLAYGKTSAYVRSVTMVCADGMEHEFGPLSWPALEQKMAQQDWEGQLYRQMYDLVEKHHATIQAARPNVSKNSSGYALWDVWDRTTFNLAKLICGSQGTLGVITQVTVGLVRPKPRRAMVVAFLKDLAPVADVARVLMQFKPESLESFDKTTLSFTLRFLPDYIKRLGARNIFTLARQFLPELWMVLTGGLPKLIVMAEFSGEDGSEVQGRAAKALEALKPFDIKSHMVHDEQEAHKYWVIRRESFNVLRSHTTGKRTVPFIDDFIVKPEYMPEFLTKLYEILQPYELTLTIAGHIGDGNFHIIPLMDLRDERIRKLIPEIADKVYGLVLHYHGSITAEHNDGLVRGPYVRRQFGDAVYELFRQVKHIWDPKNIFNPGKKIDVDWQWAMAHMRKD